MTNSDSQLHSSFNQCCEQVAPGVRALVIDIQSAAERWGAPENYLTALARTIDDLRAKNIPVTWVTMSDRNQFYSPMEAGLSTKVRDMSQLIEMGYCGAEASYPGHEIFQNFLTEHGPRINEAVYAKFYKSALMTPEDHTNRPGLEGILKQDYNMEIDLPLPGAYPGPTMKEHLRGTKSLIMMGAISTHCVVQTATDAALDGHNITILTDRVLSWCVANEDENSINPRVDRVVWQDGEAEFHENKIKYQLDEIMKDPRREFTSDDITALRTRIAFGSADQPSVSTPVIRVQKAEERNLGPKAPLP